VIVALITIAVILTVYGAVSKPLDARGIASVMMFTAGPAVGTSLKPVNIDVEGLAAERSSTPACVSAVQRLDGRRPRGSARTSGLAPAGFFSSVCRSRIASGLAAGVLVFPAVVLATAFVLSTPPVTKPASAQYGFRSARR